MFNPIWRLAIAFSEAAMADIPADVERFAPIAADMLAIAEAEADALAVAVAVAEADKAADKAAEAFGPSRFTPSDALTVAQTARLADSAGNPGMLGIGRLAKGSEFIRLAIAESWAEADGEARLIPSEACTCAIADATPDNCADNAALALALALAEAEAEAAALAAADAAPPPIAAVSCAMSAGGENGGSEIGGNAVNMATRF